MQSFIHTQDLVKQYALGSVTVPALRNVTLSMDKGEFATICGPSGSGKTTLLNLLGFIDSPSSGKVYFEGAEIRYNGLSHLHRLRLEKIGFIFQTFNLIPVLSAYENVEYPLLLTKKSARERRTLVEKILREVKLWDWRNHKPNELSGGQRQRVAIARALVNNPGLVLADEPTANIDSATAAEILDLMRTLNEEDRVTFLFSTHDPTVVAYAKRIIRLHDGAIVTEKA
ncbi:MAG TPA: ABC transporter ATP-binding protein [Bacteroidota bacterium]|nr:ABC transporter ATP-binding protein [Bacteroidota bacterium]